MVDDRIDDGGDRTAHDDADRHVNHIAAGNELLETINHDASYGERIRRRRLVSAPGCADCNPRIVTSQTIASFSWHSAAAPLQARVTWPPNWARIVETTRRMSSAPPREACRE